MEKQRMTQQEALKELENLTIDYGKRTEEEIERLDEAVDMAIAALRANAVDRPTCEDAVSRQAAIDALKGLPTWWADEGGYYGGAQPPMVALLDPEDAVSAIENLPAAQSHDIARDIATIIENEKDMRVILKNAQPDAPDTNGGDIIYRQAAIDKLDPLFESLAIDKIKALPTAQDVIRCKDCRFQDKGSNESESWNLCGYRPWLHVPTEDEHYCGYAKRRTE